MNPFIRYRLKGLWDMRPEEYRKIVELSFDAIVVADEDGIIRFWNPAAERMFGYSAEEAIGMSVNKLMPDEWRERHGSAIERFKATGAQKTIGRTIEVEGQRKDGSRFMKEMSLSAEKVSDRWVFMAVMRDVTERKRMENELRERLEDVERLNRLMVGRELKMEELRKELKRLKERIRELEGKEG